MSILPMWWKVDKLYDLLPPFIYLFFAIKSWLTNQSKQDNTTTKRKNSWYKFYINKLGQRGIVDQSCCWWLWIWSVIWRSKFNSISYSEFKFIYVVTCTAAHGLRTNFIGLRLWRLWRLFRILFVFITIYEEHFIVLMLRACWVHFTAHFFCWRTIKNGLHNMR